MGQRSRALALAGLLGLAPGAAGADETVPEFMERYEAALDHSDLLALSRIYEEWSAKRERRLRDYFSASVAELNVELSQLEVVERGGDSARIRFLRRDRFTDLETGSRVEKRIRLERTLRKHDGFWKLARD